jgi:hypothetical protein
MTDPKNVSDATSKRVKPVAVCTSCGAVSYNVTVANKPCGRSYTESGRGTRRCKGGMSSALNITDWEECLSCAASAEFQDECSDVGWICVRDQSWLRKEIAERRAAKGKAR